MIKKSATGTRAKRDPNAPAKIPATALTRRTGNGMDTELGEGMAKLVVNLDNFDVSKNRENATFKSCIKYGINDIMADPNKFKMLGRTKINYGADGKAQTVADTTDLYGAEFHVRVVARTETWMNKKKLATEKARWKNLIKALQLGLADESAKGITRADMREWMAWLANDQFATVGDKLWCIKHFDGKGVTFAPEQHKSGIGVTFGQLPEETRKAIAALVNKGERGTSAKATPATLEELRAKLEGYQTGLRAWEKKLSLGVLEAGETTEMVAATVEAFETTIAKITADIKRRETVAKKTTAKTTPPVDLNKAMASVGVDIPFDEADDDDDVDDDVDTDDDEDWDNE